MDTNKRRQHATTSTPRLSMPVALGTVLAAAAVGFGAMLLVARTMQAAAEGEPKIVAQATPAAPPAAAPATGLPAGPGSNALSVGEVAAFVFKKAPEALPEVAFQDAAGKERTLKEWRGKVVLLNAWATWCLPCRKEMPGLERLQTELGSDKFEVVAISSDRTGIEGAKKFMSNIKVEKLGLYADPSARLTSTLKIIGMPGTLLIDREGREVGRLVGPAEWDSPEAKRLIEAVLKQ